jgi:riboflavin kinase/FMN adenylyltransferase
MILHNSYTNLPQNARGCVLAIGNFDGVHLGHRSLIAAGREIALRLKAPLGVMTFEPHPREMFEPDGEPFRLTLLPMKQRLFAAMGVDALLAPAFDRTFSAITAEGFVHDVLKKEIDARHIVVGEDFTFGNRRAGTVETLENAEKEGLFGLTIVSPARCEGHDIYSSTRIRAHVRKGELADAGRLMGHPFEMESEIVKGDQRGRTIGYPTANQRVARYARMPYGIYAVRVLIEGETAWRAGAASYGIRPMFEVAEPLLETYIFDFDAEIYGKQMRVRPIAFLRPEMKFDGLETLKARIAQDCTEAKASLQSGPLLPET